MVNNNAATYEVSWYSILNGQHYSIIRPAADVERTVTLMRQCGMQNIVVRPRG